MQRFGLGDRFFIWNFDTPMPVPWLLPFRNFLKSFLVGYLRNGKNIRAKFHSLGVEIWPGEWSGFRIYRYGSMNKWMLYADILAINLQYKNTLNQSCCPWMFKRCTVSTGMRYVLWYRIIVSSFPYMRTIQVRADFKFDINRRLQSPDYSWSSLPMSSNANAIFYSHPSQEIIRSHWIIFF